MIKGLLTGCLFLISGITSAGEPTPEYLKEFAKYAYLNDQIELKKRHTNVNLRTVLLTPNVLQDLTRADLGDIAIFDQQGFKMPTWVRKQTGQPIIESKRLNVHTVVRQTIKPGYQESITIKRDNDGLTQSIEKKSGPKDAEDSSAYYIFEIPQNDTLENTAEKIRYEWLNVFWQHSSEKTLLSIKVESGNDLTHWQTEKSSVPLGMNPNELLGLGAYMQRNIKINNRHRYLRLSLNETANGFKMIAADAYYTHYGSPPIAWDHGGLMTADKDDPEYLAFKINSNVPTNGIRFTLTEDSRYLSGDIYRLDKRNKKQLYRRNIVQHIITHDPSILPSRPIMLRGNKNTQWFFKPSQPVNRPIGIKIAWPSYEVLFLTSGAGPYVIAWGNKDAKAPDNPLLTVLDNRIKQYPVRVKMDRAPNSKRQDERLNSPITAGMATENIAGGVDRLIDRETLPLLKWILWAVLILIMIVVGKIAYGLFKEMNNQAT